jgi:hypothetical protein
MKHETNLTARVLSPTFWLDDLPAEIAVLASRNNAAQARREIEAFIEKAMHQPTPIWPEDPLGRAAFILYLLKRPNTLPRFTHRRNQGKPQPGDWKLKSVLLDRPIRRGSR